jgi:predicted HNH restriction endonuclease
MTTWRMAFRAGNQGPAMWKYCYELGVAAITYEPLLRVDLTNHEFCQPKELWDQLAVSQKASMKRVAYDMKINDVIYVKDGNMIICRGKVVHPYFFDGTERIVDPMGDPWCHQVAVKWETDFPQIQLFIGKNQQITVHRMTPEDISQVEAEITRKNEALSQLSAVEGEELVKEKRFRKRNQTIIQLKKAMSDYACEACGFKYGSYYGPDVKEYIVAHHLNPIAETDGARATTLDDIALLCANCHAMVHNSRPILSITDLKARITKHGKRG